MFLRFLISWHTETFIFSYSENPQVCRKVTNLSSSAACDAVKCFSPAAPEYLIPFAVFAQVCPLLPSSLPFSRCFLANGCVWRGLRYALAAIQTSRAFEVLYEEAVKQQCNSRKKVGTKVTPSWQTDRVHLTEAYQQKHEGYRNIKLNRELQDSASGENTETNTFFKEKKKKKKRHCNSVQKSEVEYTF